LCSEKKKRGQLESAGAFFLLYWGGARGIKRHEGQAEKRSKRKKRNTAGNACELIGWEKPQGYLKNASMGKAHEKKKKWGMNRGREGIVHECFPRIDHKLKKAAAPWEGARTEMAATVTRLKAGENGRGLWRKGGKGVLIFDARPGVPSGGDQGS